MRNCGSKELVVGVDHLVQLMGIWLTEFNTRCCTDIGSKGISTGEIKTLEISTTIVPNHREMLRYLRSGVYEPHIERLPAVTDGPWMPDMGISGLVNFQYDRNIIGPQTITSFWYRERQTAEHLGMVSMILGLVACRLTRRLQYKSCDVTQNEILEQYLPELRRLAIEAYGDQTKLEQHRNAPPVKNDQAASILLHFEETIMEYFREDVDRMFGNILSEREWRHVEITPNIENCTISLKIGEDVRLAYINALLNQGSLTLEEMVRVGQQASTAK